MIAVENPVWDTRRDKIRTLRNRPNAQARRKPRLTFVQRPFPERERKSALGAPASNAKSAAPGNSKIERRPPEGVRYAYRKAPAPEKSERGAPGCCQSRRSLCWIDLPPEV
jgi:hypothetical protein